MGRNRSRLARKETNSKSTSKTATPAVPESTKKEAIKQHFRERRLKKQGTFHRAIDGPVGFIKGSARFFYRLVHTGISTTTKILTYPLVGDLRNRVSELEDQVDELRSELRSKRFRKLVCSGRHPQNGTRGVASNRVATPVVKRPTSVPPPPIFQSRPKHPLLGGAGAGAGDRPPHPFALALQQAKTTNLKKADLSKGGKSSAGNSGQQGISMKDILSVKLKKAAPVKKSTLPVPTGMLDMKAILNTKLRSSSISRSPGGTPLKEKKARESNSDANPKFLMSALRRKFNRSPRAKNALGSVEESEKENDADGWSPFVMAKSISPLSHHNKTLQISSKQSGVVSKRKTSFKKKVQL